MGFRFRRSLKLFPGLKLNIGTGGISTTIGGRGLSLNIGKRGTYLNAGIPGTGIAYREKIGTPASSPAPTSPSHIQYTPHANRELLLEPPSQQSSTSGKLGKLIKLAVILTLIYTSYLFITSLNTSSRLPAQTTPRSNAAQSNDSSVAQIATRSVKPSENPIVIGVVFVQRANVNVRASPSTSGSIVRVAGKGARFMKFKEVDGWTQVGESAPIGWIFGELLGATPP